MAEQQNPRPVQIRLDETKMHTTYANTIRTSTTAEELILDFGLNMPMQPGPDQPMQINFYVGSRVVLNWGGAKRLMQTLQQAVGAYEKHYGPIEVVPPNSGGPNPR